MAHSRRPRGFIDNGGDFTSKDFGLKGLSQLFAMIQSREEASAVGDATGDGMLERPNTRTENLYVTEQGQDSVVDDESAQTGKEAVAGNRTTVVTDDVSSASLTTAQLKTGTLNKAKVTEGGKGLRIKWSNVYVTLHESGLTFGTASNTKKTDEGDVSLQGARVQRATDREYKKKNVIQLTTAGNDCLLLQSDIDANISEWFQRIQEVTEAQACQSRDPADECDFRNVDAQSSSKAADFLRKDRAPPARRETEPVMDMMTIRKKLRNLILKRPPRQSLRDKGIIKDLVFGCPLQALCARDDSAVPTFVKLCVNEVDKRGLRVDGIYRLSGNLMLVNKLRYSVDREEKLDLAADAQDIHVVTGALKLFFRELPESLFPQKYFAALVNVVKMNDAEAKRNAIGALINSLPGPHLSTMKFLFEHLKRVVDHSAVNRMSVENVAIVFGPTLLRSERNCPQAAMSDMPYQAQVLELILSRFSALFPEKNDAPDSPCVDSYAF